MYHDWASLQNEIQSDAKNASVLHKFPETVGKDVASIVVKTLAPTLSVGVSSGEPSTLKADNEVKWTMEVLCFGLTLPLSETETIRDCVNVYCEWLSAITTPKMCVPAPIVDAPNPYACRILEHLHNLFVPRALAGSTSQSSSTSGTKNSSSASTTATVADQINRQAVLCHRVLRTVQMAAQNSTVMSSDTWDTVLKFLLGINDALLASPSQKDGIGEQLCERVLSVLFELWLLACSKSFPSPSLWKTFRVMCETWRHHEPLVQQWHRVNTALTSRVLAFMYGPDFPPLHVPDEDRALIPESMSNDCLAQCWFRFLHVYSNPVDLSRPEKIGGTPKFLHMALTSTSVIDPHHHECLLHLPDIFHKAMKGVAILVDAFLGASGGKEASEGSLTNRSTTSLKHTNATPPGQRRAKSFTIDHWAQTTTKGSSKAALLSQKQQQQQQQQQQQHHHQGSPNSSHTSFSSVPLTLGSKLPLASTRPKVNSILHLFGPWLIEAAITGVKVHGASDKDQDAPPPAAAGSSSVSSSSVATPPIGSDSASDSASVASGAPASDLPPRNYESGRAEACAALCRILTSHKTGEDILPVYLARIYIALHYGLQVNHNLSGPVLANIIFNGCDLLRSDLDGMMVLLPQILKALETILSDLEPKFKWDEHIPNVELRKASIHLLLSMLCLPLHFNNLNIKALFGEERSPVTFISLKRSIIELLLRALTVETDSTNTQMLLGGLMLCVEDLALYEEADQQVSSAATTSSSQQSNGQQQQQAGPPRRSITSESSTDDSSGGSGGGPRSPRSPLRSISVSDHPSELPDRDVGLRPHISRQMSFFDTGHGLFGHAASLVCNRLMASWKLDLNIALAAIEVLSGLAKVSLNKPNALMCKRTVNWICEFIVNQCSRPAPAHSKDLHSMIVAAFSCVAVWLVEHDYLMHDRDCLHGVLEVVELGISGTKSQAVGGATDMQDDVFETTSVSSSSSKSSKHRSSTEPPRERIVLQSTYTQNRASDIPKLKGEKELKPVSQRVRDAAEALLTIIMDHVGSFPPPCGPESVCSLLDEESLLRYCKDGETAAAADTGVLPFRYFVLDGTTVVGLLEQPLGNDEAGLPTVTALIRGPFGRHAWTMQLRHLPRHNKVSSRVYLQEPPRPAPMNNVGTHHNIKHRYFPPIVDKIPQVKADQSIPALASTMSDKASQLEKMKGFIAKQAAFENKVVKQVQEERERTPYPNPEVECRQPNISPDLHPARLLLSHWGMLRGEALRESAPSLPPAVVMLEPTDAASFLHAMEVLDHIPGRTADTVHVFYVKAGQKMPFEILNNVKSAKNVTPTFLEFLRSLGWPVDVKKHAGWTGHTSTSWKIQDAGEDEDEVYPGDTGGSLYDGRQQVLYWADILTELAFVVPSPTTYQPQARRSSADNPTALPLHHPTTATAAALKRRPERVSMPATSQPSLLHLAHHHPANPQAAAAMGTRHRNMKTTPRHNDLKPISSGGSPPSSHTEASRRTGGPPEKPSKSLSLDLDHPPPSFGVPRVAPGAGGARSRFMGRGAGGLGGTSSSAAAAASDTKVFVVWLESYEDHEHFPAAELLASTSTGLEANVSSSSNNSSSLKEPPLNIIYIHALQNGLFRIHMEGHVQGRMQLAIPLVGGMVVSRRALGSLVRQTAANICRRKRLENDAYQPPHVRRKLKIKDIVDKHRNKMTEPEFYTALFQDIPSR